MEKLLILGGSGFIASHVKEKAQSRGLKVILFDRYDNKASGDCQRFRGDVRDAEAVQEAVNLADYTINLAGILGTQETINHPIPSICTNTIGTVNFLEACRPTKFHKVRGVQIGVGNHWMQNSYSITRSTAIRFVRMYNKEHGTKVAMVRALNAYGERQKVVPVRKIIPTFVTQALAGEDIKIYGDGSQVMDMIYVKDVARILLEACLNPSVEYDRIYEAGTGRYTTVNQIAQMVITAADSSSSIVHVPMRPGESPGAVVVGNPDTLLPLGIGKLIPFEEGIHRTVAWYKNYA